jgi:flagellar biosynthetic protein FliR
MDLNSPVWALLEPFMFAAVLLGFRMLGLVLGLPGMAAGGSFPAPSRMVFVIFLTTFVYTALGMPLVPLPKELFSAASMFLKEVMIGLGMGFTVSLLFMAAEMAGTLISNSTSLSMATMMDPATGHDSSTVSTLFTITGMTLFISLDGHHHAIGGLMDNLVLFPLGGYSPVGFEVSTLIQMVDGVFLAALKIAAPMLLVSCLVNVGLGVMARAAPQLNIFVMGVSVILMIGLHFLDRSFLGLREVYEDRLPELGEQLNRNLVGLGEPPAP